MSAHPLEKRPRRAAYVLPTLFTSGNMFLGFVAILQAFQGALEAEGGDFNVNQHFTDRGKGNWVCGFL